MTLVIVIVVIAVVVFLVAAAVAVPCWLRAKERRQLQKRRNQSEMQYREVVRGNTTNANVDYDVLNEMLAAHPALASQLAAQMGERMTDMCVVHQVGQHCFVANTVLWLALVSGQHSTNTRRSRHEWWSTLATANTR